MPVMGTDAPTIVAAVAPAATPSFMAQSFALNWSRFKLHFDDHELDHFSRAAVAGAPAAAWCGGGAAPGDPGRAAHAGDEAAVEPRPGDAARGGARDGHVGVHATPGGGVSHL